MSVLSLISRDFPSPHFSAQSTARNDDGGSGGISKYLQSLAVHIPAEIIGIYVFGLSVVGTITEEFPWANNLALYFVCVVLTPVFALIAVRAKVSSSNFGHRRFLVWVLFAPTIAFVFWGLAIPDNPFVATEGAHLLAGFAAVVVSALLDSFKKVIFSPPDGIGGN